MPCLAERFETLAGELLARTQIAVLAWSRRGSDGVWRSGPINQLAAAGVPGVPVLAVTLTTPSPGGSGLAWVLAVTLDGQVVAVTDADDPVNAHTDTNTLVTTLLGVLDTTAGDDPAPVVGASR
jgi:hypothetical protein